MNNETDVKKKRQKEAFLESLTRGTSIVKACQAASISVVTIWRWRKESEDFDKEVLAVLDSRTQTVEDALYSNAVKGNVVAQIFWLKNRASDRWKDMYEGQVGGEIKLKPLRVIIRNSAKNDK